MHILRLEHEHGSWSHTCGRGKMVEIPERVMCSCGVASQWSFTLTLCGTKKYKEMDKYEWMNQHSAAYELNRVSNKFVIMIFN